MGATCKVHLNKANMSGARSNMTTSLGKLLKAQTKVAYFRVSVRFKAQNATSACDPKDGDTRLPFRNGG